MNVHATKYDSKYSFALPILPTYTPMSIYFISGWRVPFWSLGAVSATLALLLFLFFHDPPRGGSSPTHMILYTYWSKYIYRDFTACIDMCNRSFSRSRTHAFAYSLTHSLSYQPHLPTYSLTQSPIHPTSRTHPHPCPSSQLTITIVSATVTLTCRQRRSRPTTTNPLGLVFTTPCVTGSV